MDFEGSRIYARSYETEGKDRRTKSGHDRAVPLLPLAREALEWRQEARSNENDEETVFMGGKSGGRLNANLVSGLYREVRKNAELAERFTFHTLRHTFDSWLVTNGVPMRHLQEYLGHASISTTTIYAHLVDDQAMKAMPSLDDE